MHCRVVGGRRQVAGGKHATYMSDSEMQHVALACLFALVKCQVVSGKFTLNTINTRHNLYNIKMSSPSTLQAIMWASQARLTVLSCQTESIIILLFLLEHLKTCLAAETFQSHRVDHIRLYKRINGSKCRRLLKTN